MGGMVQEDLGETPGVGGVIGEAKFCDIICLRVARILAAMVSFDSHFPFHLHYTKVATNPKSK